MHHWQDFVLAISILAFNIALIPTVLAISILAFNIALIPTVLGKSKPALSTSVLTTVFMIAAVVVYVSLSLWYATFMSFINALLWGVLALQRIKQQNPSRRKR